MRAPSLVLVVTKGKVLNAQWINAYNVQPFPFSSLLSTLVHNYYHIHLFYFLLLLALAQQLFTFYNIRIYIRHFPTKAIN